MKNALIYTFVARIIIALTVFTLYPSVANANVNEVEAANLNHVFGKTYSELEWNELSTLYLDRLPDWQFPKEFEKLPKLSAVDLLHSASSNPACIDTDMQSEDIKSKINKYVPQVLNLCLDGNEYTLLERIGAGKEAPVFKIKQLSTGKEFALKIYPKSASPEAIREYIEKARQSPFKRVRSLMTDIPQYGDLVAFEGARKSQHLLVMPLLVNLQQGYTIFPLLSKGLEGGINYTNNQLTGALDKKLNPLLRADGLFLGDWENTRNYMYDDGQLKRIDFGALLPDDMVTTRKLQSK